MLSGYERSHQSIGHPRSGNARSFRGGNVFRARHRTPAWGPLTCEYYLAIHHHLFQDVYEWAGKIRSIRISKGDSAFCYPEHIHRELLRIFAELAADNDLCDLDSRQFADKAAAFVAELNAIHPFREGNGRTQLSFLVELSERAGHPLNLDRLDPAAILSATIASFGGDSRQLADIIFAMIEGSVEIG